MREGQAAAFVNEGQLADVYPPGMYTLTTENMPILCTLKGWKYGFNSPFKAEVYFISTKRYTDLKWGTQNPIMLRDPEFGPVRVRAFGTYAFQVSDPATFLRQLVATDPSFESYEIATQLRNTIVARFVDAIGQAKIAVLDLAGNYERIGQVAAGAHPARSGADGPVVGGVLYREHFAAAGGRTGARQADADGRPWQPRSVHEIAGGQRDHRCGQEPRRHGRRRRSNGGGTRNR